MNTTDAFGNNLSYKGGTWQYNLSNAGRNAKNAASNAIANAGSYQNKSRAEIARDTMNKNYLSNMLTARANQAAAMRSGARTNSNLGNISNSYARLGSQNLRNDYKQGFNDAKNSALYNANIRNALAQAANSSLQPINSMQGNLLQMITGLSGIQMNQLNNIAQAKANSYLNGQDVADLIKGLGGMVSAYSQNQQEQDNFDKLIAALSSQEKKNNALF